MKLLGMYYQTFKFYYGHLNKSKVICNTFFNYFDLHGSDYDNNIIRFN